MPISIDTYGFRKNAISQEMQDRLTSGACLACAGEVGEDYSRICRDCIVQLAEEGEKFLSPEVAAYLYEQFDPVRNLGMDLSGWAEEVLGEEARQGDVPLASQEVLTDPKKIEDKYRQVGEDEWKWEREGPVGTRTMEKLYPGSIPRNLQDLGREHVPKPTPEYSDWLERKEPGGKKKPQDEETYLTPIEPVESQLSIRHKTAVEPMSINQRREHEKQVEEFMEKQKREKTDHEKKEDNEKARMRMERLRQDRAIEEGEQEGLILKPGAMCHNHKDIPASFVLQTQILKQSGMPPRMPLCPFCAAKLDIVDLPPSEGQTCINAEYHVENPKSSPLAMRMFVHDGVIDKDAPPLPLCKDCASPFSIIVRPLTEEADVKYSKMVPLANRDKKAFVLNRLMKLANLLDSRGLFAEANEIDKLIRQAGKQYPSIKWASKNALIKALKDENYYEDNLGKAMEALTNLIHNSSAPAEELGLTESEFKELTKVLDPSRAFPNFERAKEIMGIKDTMPISPMTHNPVTGLPYSKPMSRNYCPDCGKKLVQNPRRSKASLVCPEGHGNALPCELCPHFIHGNDKCKECDCYSSYGTKEQIEESRKQMREELDVNNDF